MDQRMLPDTKETELKQIAGEVKEKMGEGGMESREAVKSVLAERIKELPEAEAETTTILEEKTVEVLPPYAKELTRADQETIEKLAVKAFDDGLDALDSAVRAAKKLNPALLDAFHDALSGVLHDELKKRGLI